MKKIKEIWAKIDPRIQDHLKSAAITFLGAFTVAILTTLKGGPVSFTGDFWISLLAAGIRSGYKAILEDVLGWVSTSVGVPFGARK